MGNESFFIRNLQRYPKGGWIWQIVFDPRYRRTVVHYATNPTGQGLWAARTIVRDPRASNVQIIRPVTEFVLPGNRQGALQIILNFFEALHIEAVEKEAARKSGGSNELRPETPV